MTSTYITQQAIKIAKNDNWFKSITERSKGKLLIDAIDFKEQAYVLAGPFAKRYAYAEISLATDVQTMEQCDARIRKDTIESLCFWPYAYQQKIIGVFGKTSEHWFSDTKIDSISDLDIKTGTHPHGYRKTGDCTLFATTEKGLKKLFSPLTEQEYEDGLKYLEPKILGFIEEAEKTIPTLEKPYKVYVCGNDDASWSKTYATYEECVQLIKDLHDYGADAMLEQMTFTN